MEAHTIEFLERSGESETTWSAFCLDCGWTSEDDRRRSAIEERAEEHRRGELRPWNDPRLSPGWDHRYRPSM